MLLEVITEHELCDGNLQQVRLECTKALKVSDKQDQMSLSKIMFIWFCGRVI